MGWVKEYLEDFISLFFPNVCHACGQAMHKGEEVICTYCQYFLPKTNFHLERDNAIEKHFWGRVNLERAAAMYYFQKGSRVQHLIHQLKYRGQTEIGVKLGKLYGLDLKQSIDYTSVDVIVPVPLHRSKEMQRSYNQVDLFCEGLSETMKKPWEKKALERVNATQTQTHKNRFERWKNVGTVFKVKNEKTLEGKHVLLADDVVTTGSTIEACAAVILAVPETKVSVATIACAVM